MKKYKRIIGFLLVLAILATSIPVNLIYASEQDTSIEESALAQSSDANTDQVTESLDAVDEPKETVSSDTIDETKETEAETFDNSSSIDDLSEGLEESTEDPANESSVEENLTQPSEENQDDLLADSSAWNFIVFGSSSLYTPDTQYIMAGLTAEDVESAQLLYKRESSDEIYTADSTTILDGNAFFSIDFDENSPSGIYVVTGLRYTSKGQTYYIEFTEEQQANSKFALNQEYTAASDSDTDSTEFSEEDIEMNIVAIDGDGNTTSVNSIEEALDAVQEDITSGALSRSRRSLRSGNVIVMIDAGHDATHAGAAANGLNEHELTLKIAQYCKAELETYSGVTVYMTRETNACPYPGTTSGVCNENRVKDAADKGASVYVSIHLNSSTTTSASGAEVYYPNANYNSAVGSEGKALAEEILAQLVALGLNDRGIKIRNSTDSGTYPDGSASDYYGVIRNSKLYGIAAVIVEHAFLTNASDAANLKSESYLQSLGVADATAIAGYFGLSKQQQADVEVSATDSDGTETNYKLEAKNVSSSNVAKVRFAVWSDVSGQDDLDWYTATKDSSGTWSYNLNVNNHSGLGVYQVHAYSYDSNETPTFIGATAFTLSTPTASSLTVINQDNAAGTFQVKLSGITSPSGVTKVYIPVWSQSDQSDLKRYEASKQSDGSYLVTVNVANHSSSGTYQIQAYVVDGHEEETLVKSTTCTMTVNPVEVSATDTSGTETTYRLQAQGVSVSSGTVVMFAVWSVANGQDDLVWYEGEKDSSGIWYYDLNVNNHNGGLGAYHIHAYTLNEDKISSFIGAASFTLSTPSASSLTVLNQNNDAGTFQVKLSGITSPSGINKVYFPVWSQDNQSDIKWYEASKQSDGSYLVTVDVANHNYNSGIYKIHAYIVDGHGVQSFVNAATCTMAATSIVISATDTSAKETNYKLEAKNVKVSSGMVVEFAVWSVVNGQDDLVWYEGEKDSSGTWYYNLNVNDHSGLGGYHVHAYTVSQNGTSSFIGAAAFTLTTPTASSLTVINQDNDAGTFQVKLSGIISPSGINKVYFPVWSQDNQSDIKWYEASKQSDGSYLVTVDVTNHNNSGTYKIHAYIVDGHGVQTFVNSAACTMSSSSVVISATDTSAKETNYKLEAKNVNVSSGMAVKFAVWSIVNGQDDLVWYDGEKDSSGIWYYNLDVTKHSGLGGYHVHAYTVSQNGTSSFIGAASFTLSTPTASSLTVLNQNNAAGTFQVKLSGITATSGINKVYFPIWSQDNQSDIKWYEATKQSDGSYLVTVNVKDHNNNMGAYKIHAYVVDGQGEQSFVKSTACIMGGTTVVISADDISGTEATYKLQAHNVSVSSGTIVSFAVWSVVNGQDDFKLYEGEKDNSGNWYYDLDINKHSGGLGAYHVYAYTLTENGTSTFIGADSFTLTKPAANSLTVLNQDNDAGTFQVQLSGITSASGVNKVYFPVWSQDNQSDIKWYEASKQSDGSYLATVDAANHYYNSGTYKIHAYIVDGHGEQSYVNSTTTVVAAASAAVLATDTFGTETTYKLQAQNVRTSSDTEVKFAVWSVLNGQDDLEWYDGKKDSSGNWYYDLDVNKHSGGLGAYHVHAYTVSGNGTSTFAGAASFTLSTPAASSLAVLNQDNDAGTFQIKLSGITSPSGVNKVYFPVWCQDNQSDIKWYEASRQSDGSYIVTVNAANHNNNSGTYKIHAYIVDGHGVQSFVNSTTCVVAATSVVVSATDIYDTQTIYKLQAQNVRVSSGTEVQFAVWSIVNGQDDLKWYTAQKDSSGTWYYNLDVNKHSGLGAYHVHAYTVTSNGTSTYVGAASFTLSSPTAESLTIINQDNAAGTFQVKLSGITSPSGVSKVYFPVWNQDDQSDIKWYEGSKQSDGSYLVTVNIANHHNNNGTYKIHAYIVDGHGVQSFIKGTSCTITKESVALEVIQDDDAITYQIKISGITAVSGIKAVNAVVWSQSNQSDIKSHAATKQSDGTYLASFNISDHNNNIGTYQIRIYITDDNGVDSLVGSTTCTVTEALYEIMGTSSVTVSQMVAYYNASGFTYPDTELGKGGASRLEQFCQIYLEEAAAEGVRAEVAFCQSMKETAYLQYGGDVSITQFNFCGLGATGSGVSGSTFNDVRTGIRAHIQHLKAYASKESLVNDCVDERFQYVTRGSALYVEWLGQKENPDGLGWATSVNYGYQIVAMIKSLKTK